MVPVKGVQGVQGVMEGVQLSHANARLSVLGYSYVATETLLPRRRVGFIQPRVPYSTSLGLFYAVSPRACRCGQYK